MRWLYLVNWPAMIESNRQRKKAGRKGRTLQAGLYVRPLYVDVVVAVGARLLVEEADGVHELVYDDALLYAAAAERQLQASAGLLLPLLLFARTNRLAAAVAADERPAAAVRVDVDVVVLARARHEADARLPRVVVHRRRDARPPAAGAVLSCS